MWDDIDELVDYWVWIYYMTRKLTVTHRASLNVIFVTEDVDYRYQDHPEWWQNEGLDSVSNV